MGDAGAATGLDPREAALGTTGLTRRFGGVVAVDDVDFAVAAGEIHSLIGPNGAGKTTLLNVLTDAIPPTEGAVWLDGEDVTAVPEERRVHRGLARSFQATQLFADLSVVENVRIAVQTARSGPFAVALRGEGRARHRERAMAHVERVGLGDVAESTASALAHGDQRRLGVAIALATEPSVLLLDEPTSGMGPTETAETAEMIEDLQAELGLSVVLVEHDVGVVLSVSDRITVLDGGRVIATGDPDAVRDDEAVQEAYLGGTREEP